LTGPLGLDWLCFRYGLRKAADRASVGALAWGAGRLAGACRCGRRAAEAKISADKSALDRVGFLIPFYL